LNRLAQKSYPETSTVNYTYDNDSRLTQVSDPTGAYQFTFDNMGRLTGTTTNYAFLTGRSFTTSYGYDAASNRTSFTDPESGSSGYVYDTLNRLQTLTPPAAISSGSFGFGYDGGWPGHKNLERLWVPRFRFLRVGSWVNDWGTPATVTTLRDSG